MASGFQFALLSHPGPHVHLSVHLFYSLSASPCSWRWPASVGCLWLTLESALITAQIPSNSFLESGYTGELTPFHPLGGLGACV